jgi:hypothetical protein
VSYGFGPGFSPSRFGLFLVSLERLLILEGGVSERLLLTLDLAENLLLYLKGVYIHSQAPRSRPVAPGPHVALIDSGASHSWVKPSIGDKLEPHSLEGYVVRRGDGVEEDAGLEVKFGFMKGLQGKPVKGWVQLDARLPAYGILLFSGEFGAPADIVIGMDIMCSFIQCGVLVRGTAQRPSLAIEY